VQIKTGFIIFYSSVFVKTILHFLNTFPSNEYFEARKSFNYFAGLLCMKKKHLQILDVLLNACSNKTKPAGIRERNPLFVIEKAS